MSNPPLADLSPATFLADYWQKRPLLIRNAVERFDWLPDLAELITLAGRDEVESRLVEQRQGRWRCENGPFKPARFKRLADSDWTVLIQNVNHHIPFAAELLHRFNFIPQVRLDDLMISYAPAGGGVGPHFDSYDVFLLQVGGRKRWRISSQDDLELVEDAPLKILKRFQSEQEWVLEHGDMLYLPPRFAHDGVALEPGMTWSIGFRAPSTQELATQFLDFLRDRINLDGRYADPDLRPTAEPARLPEDFLGRVSAMLAQITWDEALVREFAGCYFSEPKPHVFYDSPDDLPDEDEFAAELSERGIVLDLKSVMLFDDERVYLNGEVLDSEAEALPVLRQLANERHLPPADYPEAVIEVLYQAFDDGYLQWPAD
ncbi:JmjC domain-containing protein [Chitinimonas lacunae]|uniref:JmjC domain-containing protein n=1 Tax=Chitinimonas lacunae TaxID=1963018 RepID=A0ABV8MLS5_9NEIS